MAQNKKGLTGDVRFQLDEKDGNTSLEHDLLPHLHKNTWAANT